MTGRPDAPMVAAGRIDDCAAAAPRRVIRTWRGDGLTLVVVIAAATLLAASLFGQFLAAPRVRWDSLVHDRNGHYLFALNLADDVRRGDLPRFIIDLDKAQGWPPLHGLSLAGLLVVRGFDYRLGVLPSLVAWIGTAVFGFLLARRLVPRWRTAAGFMAAALILGSPAHQEFAVDVMLESLGACLSLAALYTYAVARQHSSLWAVRALCFSLTLLFFVKGNYWLLVVSSLLVVEASRERLRLYDWFRRAVAQHDWSAGVRRATRQPLDYVLLLLLALITVSLLTPLGRVTIGSLTISFSPPRLLVTAAYAIVLFRAGRWWWGQAAQSRDRVDPRLRVLLHWHVVPIAVWFLWPRRLASFLLHASPTNAPAGSSFDLWSGAAYYARAVVSEYHANPGGAAVVLALVIAALLWHRRMRPGGDAVALFLIVSMLLTCMHPHRQYRFAHSWIAAAWVLAGVGLALLVARTAAAGSFVRRAAIAGLVLVVGIALSSVVRAPRWPRSAHGSFSPASVLELTDAYLSHVATSRRLAVVSTVPMESLIRWTWLERYGSRQPVALPLDGLDGSTLPTREAVAAWLRRSAPDTVVFVNVPPGSVWYTPEVAIPAHQLEPLLADTLMLAGYERLVLPVRDCTVTMWRTGPLHHSDTRAPHPGLSPGYPRAAKRSTP